MTAPFKMILRPYAKTSGAWHRDNPLAIDDDVLISTAGDYDIANINTYIEADKDDDGQSLQFSMSVLGSPSGFQWPIGYCDDLRIKGMIATNFTSTTTFSYGFAGGTSSTQTVTPTVDSAMHSFDLSWPLTAGPEAFGAGGTAKDYILVNLLAPASISTGKWVRIDYLYVELSTRPHNVGML